jgi:hypothetical protein
VKRARAGVIAALGVAVALVTTAAAPATVLVGSSQTRPGVPAVGVVTDSPHQAAAVQAAGQLPAQALHHDTSTRREVLARMLADPARNVAASPGFSSCWTARMSSHCLDLELAAINHARAGEDVGPMVLPRGFAHESTARQVFIVTDLERTARGLRPFAMLVGPLDSLAATAAHQHRDPSLPSWTVGRAHAWQWVSNWADDINPLAADYDYMYNDGYSRHGTINGDCTSPRSNGCWSHRHNILTRYPRRQRLLLAGAAAVQQGQLQSSAIIMVGASGRAPHAVYTWRQALK